MPTLKELDEFIGQSKPAVEPVQSFSLDELDAFAAQQARQSIPQPIFDEPIADPSDIVAGSESPGRLDIEQAVAEIPQNLKISGINLAEGLANAAKRRLVQVSGGGILPDDAVLDQFEVVEQEEKTARQREVEAVLAKTAFGGSLRRLREEPSVAGEALGVVTRLPDVAGKLLRKKGEKEQEKLPEVTLKDAPITRLLRPVVQNSSSIGVSIGAALISGDPLVGLAILGETEGGQEFQNQLEKGGSVRKAEIIGGLSQAAEVAGESLVFPKFIKGLKEGIPLKRALVMIAENATQEGATGFTQRFLSVFGEETSAGKTIKEAADIALLEGAKAVPENAWVGGATAGLVDIASLGRGASQEADRTQLDELDAFTEETPPTLEELDLATETAQEAPTAAPAAEQAEGVITPPTEDVAAQPTAGGLSGLEALLGEVKQRVNVSAEEKAKFSKRDIKALAKATGPLAKNLNKKLREGTELSAQEKEIVGVIDTTIEKLPSFEGTVNREVDLTAEQVEQIFPVGEAITEKGLTATSKQGVKSGFKGNVSIEIESKTGRDLGRFSAEGEVLFPTNTQFDVLSVDTSDADNIKVKLRESQPTPTAKPEAVEVARPVEEVIKPKTPESFQGQPKVSEDQPVRKETAATVEEAVKTDVTGPTFPLSTREEAMSKLRKRMGLNAGISPTSVSDQQVHEEAIAQGIPERAEEVADEIIANPEKLTDVKLAGIRIAIAEVEIEREALEDLVAKTDNDADIMTLSEEANRVQNKFNKLDEARRLGTSSAARTLRQARVELKRDLSLAGTLSRAKLAAGKKLTAVQEKIFKGLNKKLKQANQKLEALTKENQKLKALKFLKQGKKRLTGQSRQQRNANLSDLVNRTKELLEQGCLN